MKWGKAEQVVSAGKGGTETTATGVPADHSRVMVTANPADGPSGYAKGITWT